MSQFIGIDFGTSFLKGAVLDLEARRLDQIRRRPAPGPLPGLPPRRHELDPAAVTAAVRALIEELLPLAPRCAGIVTCTQMHSVVLAGPDGAPLSTVATWLDQRALDPHPAGATYLDVLAARLGPGARLALGNELRPGLPISALFWLAERGELPAGATPLTLADFALQQLCGGGPGVDLTNAAAAGALDLVGGAWHAEALAAAGLAGLRWPPIIPFHEPLGIYRSAGRAIPCYRPVGDAQCALLGAGLALGELSVNVATGSQVSLLRPAPLPGAHYQARPFFNGLGLSTISGIPAGRSLNVLVGLLAELAAAQGAPAADPWPYLIQAAEAAPDSELQIDLAFFGEAAGGAITGIREGNLTAGGLLRAALRRMAASYEEAALHLAPDRGWHQVVLSGGLAQRSRLLRELVAAQLRSPYRQGPSEDTLSGLLALALVCAGAAPDALAAARQLQAAA